MEIPRRRRADRRLFGSVITLKAVVAHFSVYMSHYCFFFKEGVPVIIRTCPFLV